MALPNLGGHSQGGTITEGQDTKENTSNLLDALLDNSVNAPDDFSVTAGGTFNLNTPQDYLDIYLANGLIRLTGSPVAATTIIVPDGNRRIAFANVSSQATTINTVTGASSPVSIPAASVLFFNMLKQPIIFGRQNLIIGRSTSFVMISGGFF